MPNEKSDHINKKYSLKDPYILCVTKFLPYKNIGRLIDAFEKTRKVNSNVNLVIVGQVFNRSKYFCKILDKIELLGLNDNITIIDEIPREDLLFLYSRCHFLIFTSLYESIGIILMDGDLVRLTELSHGGG